MVRKKKRTSEEIETLLSDAKELFESGISAEQISRIKGIHPSVTNRYLKEWGCDTSRGSTQRSDPLKNYKDEIIQDYLNGISSTELITKYECGENSIIRILKKNGIPIRDNRKWEVNENYFDYIDNKDKAVYLGFFASDGNNSNGSISWQVCDLDILEEIAADMQYNGPIKCRNKSLKNPRCKDMYSLRIHRQQLSDMMTKWGCPPNKTHIVQFPNFLSDELTRSFCLGYFLGDGHLSRRQFSVIGNDKLIIPYAQFLDNKLSIEYKIYHDKRNPPNIVSMRVTKQKYIKSIIDYLYCDHKPYMNRKYESYLKISQEISQVV